MCYTKVQSGLSSDSHKIESRRCISWKKETNSSHIKGISKQLRNRIDSPARKDSSSFCKYLQQRRMIQLNFFYVFLFKDSLASSSSQFFLYSYRPRLLFGGLTLSISRSTYIQYLNVFFIDLDAHKNSRKQLCSLRYNAFTTLEQPTTSFQCIPCPLY